MKSNTEQTEPTTESLAAQLAEAEQELDRANAALSAVEPAYNTAVMSQRRAWHTVAEIKTQLRVRAATARYGEPLSWQAVAAALRASGHHQVSRGAWLDTGFSLRQVDRFRVAISHVGRHVGAEAVAKYAATITAHGWVAMPHDYGLIVSRRYVESEASVAE